MSKSYIFKKAHEGTKQILQEGDSYSATFAAVLKFIYGKLKEMKQKAKTLNHEETLAKYNEIKQKEKEQYEAERKAKLLKEGKEARKINKTLGLNQLKGSAKQKAWGEKIRAEFVKTVSSEGALQFIESAEVAQHAKFWIETRAISDKTLEKAMHDLITATAEANKIGAGNEGYAEQVEVRQAALKVLGV